MDTELQDAQITGDRVLLERLVSNLIDNAVRHNVPGGWVTASIRRHEGRVELAVANGGESVPADQVTGLFEPFRRLSGRAGERAARRAPALACPSSHRWPGARWRCRGACQGRWRPGGTDQPASDSSLTAG